ncbi:MAG: dicarboxylate/amino acid:cation symporter [Gemmatimonadaceae bacterium]|nr:dicarboxylate/amino acid:cation symporter [Gemmatimonadaceae bacterium]
MSPTLRLLIGLVLGFALGLAASASGVPMLRDATRWIEPAGTLFIAAIRMTVIPLVVSSLLVGVASRSSGAAVGRLGARAVMIFVVGVAITSAMGLLVGVPLLARLPLDAEASAALRATAGAASALAAPVGLRAWLIDLVPVNPVKAAAEGQMLPLIVFSLAFGAAARHASDPARDTIVRGAEAVQDVTLVLVRAILAWAPIGVFALAVPLAGKLGIAALGAVASYIAITCAVCVLSWVLVFYPAAHFFGRRSWRSFLRGALPAQAVAFSSRSSMAALPAMMEAVRGPLALSEGVRSFVIPFAATIFRAGGGVAMTVGAVFLAKLYGVPLDLAALVTIGATTVIATFAVPGIPGGAIIALVPVLLAARIPVEGIGILLAVDTIPDMFRTTTNVTADLAVATFIDPPAAESA